MIRWSHLHAGTLTELTSSVVAESAVTTGTPIVTPLAAPATWSGYGSGLRIERRPEPYPLRHSRRVLARAVTLHGVVLTLPIPRAMNSLSQYGTLVECWGGPDDGLLQWVPCYQLAVARFRDGSKVERLFACPHCRAPATAVGVYRPTRRGGRIVLAWNAISAQRSATTGQR